MTHRWTIAALAAAVVGTSIPAAATIMIPLSIEDMTARAVTVVRARVADSSARWDGARKHIHTYTNLEILDVIAGDRAKGDVVVVRTLGGAVGEIGMKVSGTAKFESGEEIVVFLTQEPLEAGTLRVVGMSQGKYDVRRDAGKPAIVVPGLEGVAFAARGSDGVMRVDRGAAKPGTIALQDLEQRVRSVSPTTSAPNISTPTDDPRGPTPIQR